MKKFWKKSYYGYLAFIVGLAFLLLAKLQTFFLLLGIICFFAGAVLNLVLTFKKFKADNDEINIKLIKIQQILEEENENLTQEQISVNSQVVEKLNNDANKYKFSLALQILIYLAVCILSVIYFILSFKLL